MSAGLLGGILAPSAGAWPDTAAEQEFLSTGVGSHMYLRATDVTLIKLGYQACAVRRSGMSSDDAKAEVWKTLDGMGIEAAGAVVGSLVHAAVDTLCPEVGYP